MKFNNLDRFYLLLALFLVLFFGLFKLGRAQSYPVPIIWQNLVGVISSGNTITKTTPNGWGAGASGASSTQYIPSSQDAYVEFRMTNNAGMAGLSNGDPDPDYREIDYAIQAGPNYGNTVVVYENAVQKATSPMLYSSGDLYRVSVESGVIKYYQNGTLIYTSTQVPRYPLLFDTALYANGGQIRDAVIAGSLVYPSPPVDTRPLRISNVKIINITQTGATVTWDTDKPSDSQVEYCITASRCRINSTLNAGLTTSHSIDLSGLTYNTYYFIWVKSKNGAGNVGVSGYHLFRTASGATSTPINTPSPTPILANPPVISNLQVINITRDSATVIWNTDRPTDGSVFSCFARVFCFRSLVFNQSLSMDHSLNLSSLRADFNNYISISSKDANGESSFNNISFKTQPGLVVSNIKANMTRTTLAITWDTNYASNSALRACRFPFFCLGAKAYDSVLSSAHSMIVTNLRPGTRYYYQLTSMDVAGYTAVTPSVYITTLP